MATIATPRDQSPAGIARTNSPSRGSPSFTGTPTSSVRPSLDLNRFDRNNNGANSLRSASPQPGAPTQRRNRAALRDYYNLKSKGLPGQTLSRTASVTSITSESTVTSTGATQSTPKADNTDESPSPLSAQLDEPSFDADKYISSLLQTCSLRDILRTESALVSEIRTLDGERKALVYDNYSKLIKAVGTIGDMQRGMRKGEDHNGTFSANMRKVSGTTGRYENSLDGVEKLEATLAGLSETVKQLAPTQTKQESTAAEARQRRERKRQKELVKWVLNAPGRLEGYLQRDEKEKAEEEYETIKKLLVKWDGVKGVQEVKVACEKVMRQLDDEEEGDDDDDEG